MESRSAAATRLSVIPVLVALAFNLVLPVLSVAVPQVTPTALRPQVAEAGATGLNIVKTADADSIEAGDEASFHIVIWNAGPGDTLDSEFFDQLPPGEWDFELINVDGDDACGMGSGSVPGGEPVQTVSCSFGTLAPSGIPVPPFDAESAGKVIRVFRDTTSEDCGTLHNGADATAWADASNNDRVFAEDSIVVTCPPTLVIDKGADAEVITISGPANAPVADPSIVTWTLTYTLTSGPVTNAVITDAVPEGFVFLDASAGGQPIDGVVTWTFPTLTASGSVSFRTTVDVGTISLADPTVNTALIDSDETAPDEGQDSVTVVREATAGGNPTPKPSVPDTAAVMGSNSEPITVPVELLAALFLGSSGAMALANVRARYRRR